MKMRGLSLFFLLAFAFFILDVAKAEETVVPQTKEKGEINNGQDITKPLTRVDLRYEYRNLSKTDSNHDDVHIATVRVDKPFDLSPNWILATRLDIPFMLTNKRSIDNYKGNTEFAPGDLLLQALVINIINEDIAWTAGAQLVLPTAAKDTTGTGSYRIVPTAGLRIATNEVLDGSWFALAARWDKDFASSRSHAGKVNELQLAPMVNIPLQNAWFINLFPSTDIRYNMGDKRNTDSGRWFVPANALIGKMLTKNLVGTMELGVPIVQQYQVYDFKTEMRLGYFF